MKLPAGFQLIGQVVCIYQMEAKARSSSLACVRPCTPLLWRRRSVLTHFLSPPQGLPDYTKWLTHYSTKKRDDPAKPIVFRSYAR